MADKFIDPQSERGRAVREEIKSHLEELEKLSPTGSTMPNDLLPKPDGTLGRVSVLVEERPQGRASVRLHMRQFEGADVQATIEVARVRLEQLLRDAAKVTAIQEVIARWDSGSLGRNLGLHGDPLADHRVIEEIKGILEAP